MAYSRKRKVVRRGRRLRNNVNKKRKANYGGPIARGVSAAGRVLWNNRNSIVSMANRAVATGNRYLANKRKRTRSTTGRIGTMQVVGGNTIEHSYRKFGRYPSLKPSRLYKMARMSMSNCFTKFQGVTNFDTNVGFFPLSNRLDSTTGDIVTPMHVMELTNFEVNAPLGGMTSDYQPVLLSTYWDNSTGSIIRTEPLWGQNAANDALQANWTHTTADAWGHSPFIMHEWTSLNLNLYGSRNRNTTFYIDFVQFPDEKYNFITNPGVESAHMASYLTSSLRYSNLLSRDKDQSRNIRFVRRFRYEIPAETSIDLNTNTGKIQHVKIFQKHGKIFDMRHGEAKYVQAGVAEESSLLPVDQANMADYQWNGTYSKTVKNGARMYVIIRTTQYYQIAKDSAGWAATGTNFPETYFNAVRTVHNAAATSTEPSYDMVVRQKYSYNNRTQHRSA